MPGLGCAVLAALQLGCAPRGPREPLPGELVRVSGAVDLDAALHADAPVIVYLERSDEGLARPGTSEPGEAELEIVDGALVPRVPVIAPGQALHFRSHDAIYHELFALAGENSFRVNVPSRERSTPVVLPRPGPVVAFCELHPDETHLILVSAARLHTLVDTEGRFAFSGVRPGTYRLGAVGVHARSEVHELRMRSGDVARLTLRLEAH